MNYHSHSCRSPLLMQSKHSLSWIHIKLLGTGTFGYVDHVRHSSEHTWEFARKTIKYNEKMDINGDLSATAIREISILKTLDHPNIIKLAHVEYNFDKKDFLSFFLEIFPIDLKRYIDACLSTERLSSKLIQSYTYQILCAIDYLHRRAIIHRDIKPSNIVIDFNGHLKLADFGLARRCRIPERALTHEVVTLWYRPPEILLNAPTYGMPLDIWGVGCVFAEMCLRRPLFRGECEIDQLLLIFRLFGTPSVVEWPDIANCLYYQANFPNFPINSIELSQLPILNADRQLLSDILIYNPQNRPTAKHLIEQHPYFNCQSILILEKPIQTIIDRAIRLQTENMKHIVI
ncbi:unnamed protein product [Adineta steineri]|uniref:cyclin-dependent kinase n=1 Tax=Adineta steineri TaxID=433720 RepID=A0A815H9P9_9BILA|nr:unnamed protein product [Adineta steineri]CAF3783627.1 unnamed protein product [Adineta steineri]CAF3815010.1 unnamed protein product [Adineta steineri]